MVQSRRRGRWERRRAAEQCFIRAVEIDDQHATAWFNLGFVGGGSVSGQQHTKQQCYIRALEVGDQHTYAWQNLGVVGGGNVSGRQYTQQQCLDRAAELKAAA